MLDRLSVITAELMIFTVGFGDALPKPTVILY
jgi:hypothetical protein